MESTLMFFLVGLAIFGAKKITAGKPLHRRLSAFLFAGLASGALTGWLGGHPLSPAIELPSWLNILTGLFGASVCFIADQKKLIDRPGLKYGMTAGLGGLVAGFAWGAAFLYQQWVDVPVHTVIDGRQQLIIFLAVGFVTVFGFTFPARWFK